MDKERMCFVLHVNTNVNMTSRLTIIIRDLT